MKPVGVNVSFPALEEQILALWREQGTFKRSMSPRASTKLSGEPADKDRPSYVFYDGPPFATGLPHYGHLLAGTIKDVIGRFFTMKGLHVDRRFGWDCHGLPVEFEIQKALDLHGSKAIREFGVARFNEECRKIVLRYTKEWRWFVERSGRWVDFEREYRTMDLPFMESIWWVLNRLWERGLVYEGVKCVPYSWGINTPLSNFEANLNYKQVQDPAVTVRVPLLGDVAGKLGLSLPTSKVSAYIWTTTPWTLPSNLAIAVGPEISYSLVFNRSANEVVVVATNLAAEHFPSLKNGSPGETAEGAHVLGEVPGSKLVGLEYQPLFPYFVHRREQNAFRIYPGEFVTATEGTGLVHQAAFGEDDVQLFGRFGIPIVDPIDEDGRFTSDVTELEGLGVKEADPKVIASLKERGLLVSHKTIEHSYPFCWRTDTPLIYKTIPTWFVKVEAIRDELIQMNNIIHWVPGHLRQGRMGKWLEGVRDWAISRNRFWGTPLPIWRCDGCNRLHCIGSVEELEGLAGERVSDLHSHFIDRLSWPCAKSISQNGATTTCNGSMRRVPEVLDCWFESGSMPYAQAHYPFEGKERFEQNFPADFIAEGLDQTRGWFYTLLVLSTALFGRPAFKNVIVNGIVLAEDGKKMSKSLKNYPPPDEVMNEFGADAMRLYLLASAATRAEELRFSKAGVQQVVRQNLLPLWNAYNFFVTYALVDKWSSKDAPATASTNLLDQWILSRVASLIGGVSSALSSYHLYAAAQPILEFIDQLTDWYIRLNRRRFWSGNEGAQALDKQHAYATLHKVLLAFSRVLAPLAPFISEEIFQNLSRGVNGIGVDSVHLAPFPSVDEFGGDSINPQLERTMELFEEVILLGRSLRNENSLKFRQPLARITLVYPGAQMLEQLKALDVYIREELNVKEVEYLGEEERYVTLKAQLNTKSLGAVLGPKLGSDGMKRLRVAIEALSTDGIRAIEDGHPFEFEGVSIRAEDLVIKRAPKGGIKACASSGQITIVLDTSLTRELKLEGLAREFVNRVQKQRKDAAFDVTDRVVLCYMTACPQLTLALHEYGNYICQETLAVELQEVRTESELLMGGRANKEAHEIAGKGVIISIARVQG